jgi:hypothetical protein
LANSKAAGIVYQSLQIKLFFLMTGFGNSDSLVDQVGFVNHGSKQIRGVGFANPDL